MSCNLKVKSEFVYSLCLFSGAKVRNEIYEAFENIYPILKGFKKQ